MATVLPALFFLCPIVLCTLTGSAAVSPEKETQDPALLTHTLASRMASFMLSLKILKGKPGKYTTLKFQTACCSEDMQIKPTWGVNHPLVHYTYAVCYHQ